jgi:hypothetical protein
MLFNLYRLICEILGCVVPISAAALLWLILRNEISSLIRAANATLSSVSSGISTGEGIFAPFCKAP